MTLLAIDIGNTSIKLGLFEDQELRQSFRLSSVRDRTADEYSVIIGGLLESRRVDAAVAASVVPPLNAPVDGAVRRLFDCTPVFVDPVAMELMPIRTDYPAEVGVDRIVNSYAARKLYGCPCIVIDFGTATTFDVVSAEGAYEGGAIAAGVEISAEALFERTALLPRIRLELPARIIGKNTREAMLIGLYEGLLGQIDFIVRRFRQQLGPATAIIATGGLAEEMAGQCRLIEKVDNDLCLKGLAMIFNDRIASE